MSKINLNDNVKDTHIRDNIYITENDLNAVQHMNSSTSQNINGFREIGITGDVVKALKNYGIIDKNTENKLTNNYTDFLTFYNMLSDSKQFLMSKWKWKNLVDDIDEMLFETLLQETGKFALVNFHSVLIWTPFKVIEQHIFTKKPIVISVDDKSSKLHDELIDEKNFVIFKHDPFGRTTTSKTLIWILKIIEVLKQIHQNVFVSIPKVIIEPKNKGLNNTTTNQPDKDNWDKIIGKNHSGEIVHVVNDGVVKTDGKIQTSKDILGENKPTDLFQLIELKDRTKELIENYLFLYDNLKETMGASQTSQNKKQERVNLMEMETQQDTPVANLEVMFRCRENAINESNKKFGTNMSIEKIDVKENDKEINKGVNDEKIID